MARSHRLRPHPVAQEAVLHAFISPPIPEKGCPPTLIVTPPEPTSASDFQIHFFSTESSPVKVPYFSNVTSRLRSVFLLASPPKSTSSSAKAEQPMSLLEEKEMTIETSVSATRWSPIPPAEYQYTAIPTAEESEGLIRLSDDDDEEEEENTDDTPLALMVLQQRKVVSATRTRQMRIILLIAIPLAVIFVHLVSHRMGFGITPFEDDSEMATE